MGLSQLQLRTAVTGILAAAEQEGAGPRWCAGRLSTADNKRARAGQPAWRNQRWSATHSDSQCM